MGVDSLFSCLTNVIVLRMKVLTQLMEGPNLSIFLARAMDPQRVSVFLILPVSSL